MQKLPLVTKDGSHTISIPEMGVTYHSIHGAIQESMHVFIEAGLRYYLANNKKESVAILEMGFGTGLNALLTLIEAQQSGVTIRYTSLEAFPIDVELVATLNYCQLLSRNDLQDDFLKLHHCNWQTELALNKNSLFCKYNKKLEDYESNSRYDIIYFDAFAPAAQPELWTVEVFSKLFNLLNSGGVLVTYCSKGDVRRTLQSAGFIVTRIPGPPGKREMLRAEKFNTG